MGLRRKFGQVVHGALHAEVASPLDLKPEVADIYREKLGDWITPDVTYKKACVADLSALDLAPVRRLFTISDIFFDPKDHASLEFGEKDVVWRWKYHEFAFTIFWALSFHLTNREMEHYDRLWNEIVAFAEFVHPEIKKDPRARRAMFLALYERCLGIEADVNGRVAHYVRLIENHPDEGGLLRVQLFAGYKETVKLAIQRSLA